MSIPTMNWVWEQEIGANEKLVLLCLIKHADRAGKCWPAQDRIGQFCSLSRRTVNRCIKRLCDTGLLRMQQQRSETGIGPNLYFIQSNHYVTELHTLRKVGARKSQTFETIRTGLCDTESHELTHRTKNNITPLFSPLDPTEAEADEPPVQQLEQSTRRKPKRAWRDQFWEERFDDVALEHFGLNEGELVFEREKFINSAHMHDRRYANWFAAWRNWLASPYCTSGSRNRQSVGNRSGRSVGNQRRDYTIHDGIKSVFDTIRERERNGESDSAFECKDVTPQRGAGGNRPAGGDPGGRLIAIPGGFGDLGV